MTYEDQLKDERWISLRNQILLRDYHTCRKCFSQDELHVHHKQYIEGRLAWEYDPLYLITLCSECHKKEHEGKELKDFIKPPDLIIELGARIRRNVVILRELAKRSVRG